MAELLQNVTDSWQYRAIAATRGNRSKLGCVVLAILGKAASNPPRFVSSAVITAEGVMLSSWEARDGNIYVGQPVCEVEEFVNNLRGLADHLKLDDADRVAMFDAARAWVSKDYRAKSELFE